MRLRAVGLAARLRRRPLDPAPRRRTRGSATPAARRAAAASAAARAAGGSGRSVQARSDDRDPDALRLDPLADDRARRDVKVEFNNAFAQDPHNLLVEGPGGPA